MKKLKIAILAVVAIIVVALLTFERREQSRLRTEIVSLREQVQNLTMEKESLSSQAVHETSGPLSEKEFRELLKLRGEVGRLHQQLREIEDRSPKTQAPIVSNAPISAPVIAFGTELHDMGATTPERAANPKKPL